MRYPLIALISIFTVSVLGLTLIPGDSPDGPWRMGFFDAFYFMSYTATTIGYGEIPLAFNDTQRMWVTLSIYLTVIGWAYALGTLFALLQSRAFLQALGSQRFRRQVRRLRSPFWILAGHGQTGELLGRWLDGLGHQFVALDLLDDRLDVLDLGSYSGAVPALAADAGNPEVLVEAGLLSACCVGVLALTDDEEVNLAITMTSSLLRPDVPVIVRSTSQRTSRRLRAFGNPTIINPYDRFGDHFAVALRSPSTEQLAGWLTRPPGEPLPKLLRPTGPGLWVVCGFGRFGAEITRDLQAEGAEVAVIDFGVGARSEVPPAGVRYQVGDGTEPGMMQAVGVERAAGFVAATDHDVTNLLLIAAARAHNPSLFIVGRQNQPVNAELFAAMNLDLLMVETVVVVQEALAHIATPLLWRFLEMAIHRDDEWAAELIRRLVERNGPGSPELWHVELTDEEAPAVTRRVRSGRVLLGDLLRDPQDRDHQLEVVILMVAREAGEVLVPEDDLELQAGDRLLLAGRAAARRAMESTLELDASAAYVIDGRAVGSSWLWRTLTRDSRA
jgi:Trk K+ transport system NAD-binding subunit